MTGLYSYFAFGSNIRVKSCAEVGAPLSEIPVTFSYTNGALMKGLSHDKCRGIQLPTTVANLPACRVKRPSDHGVMRRAYSSRRICAPRLSGSKPRSSRDWAKKYICEPICVSRNKVNRGLNRLSVLL